MIKEIQDIKKHYQVTTDERIFTLNDIRLLIVKQYISMKDIKLEDMQIIYVNAYGKEKIVIGVVIN